VTQPLLDGDMDANVTSLTAASKPTQSNIVVGPTEARRWLATNVRNRHLRKAQVTAYARDMAAGRWKFTGESIKFDRDGHLLDGQHRLAAIVQSGVSITMPVMRGLDPDVQHNMDAGIRRKGGDALALDGHKYANTLAAAARLAILWNSGRLSTTDKGSSATTAEQVAFVNANPDLIRAVELAATVQKQLDCPQSVVACAWWALARIDVFQANEFFMDLANMQFSDTNDPRVALLRRLQTARRNRERIPQVAHLALVIRAWNAVRAGKPLLRMPTISRNGRIDVPVPR
jgi:hypothetical protein